MQRTITPAATVDRPAAAREEGILPVLKDRFTVAILLELGGQARKREELDARLPGLSRAGLTRRLSRLALLGLIEARPFADPRGRVRYALTERGSELLVVLEEIAALGSGRGGAERLSMDALLLALGGGRRARAVARALVEGPLSFAELSRRLPHIPNAPLCRHLRRLDEAGVVRKRPADGSARGRPLYELTGDARRLGRLVLLIACWRARWMPGGAPPLFGDLQGLVHLVAPLGSVPSSVSGMCLLRQTLPSAARAWPDTYVSVGEGRLWPLPLALPGRVDARAEALPEVWCDALLSGRVDGVAVEGDRELMAAVLAGLAQALRA
jgi:DNA-binding HxlR family transcriptional regulator